MPQLIITDANARQQIQERCRRLDPAVPFGTPGCLPRTTKYGYAPHAKPAGLYFPRIPRDRWPPLIAAGKGTWLSDLRKGKLPPHDQGITNYCWAHGSVRAVEVLRVYEAQAPLLLSAESVAVPITGGVNRGGTPEEALEQLRLYGACDQTYWPLNDRNIQHAGKGWATDAENHIILGWADIENFEDQMTLALHRVPVAIGLAWWGHLVCQLDPVILDDGKFAIGIDNSWGPDWGENGYGILDEKHGTADLGAFAPISETFSTT